MRLLEMRLVLASRLRSLILKIRADQKPGAFASLLRLRAKDDALTTTRHRLHEDGSLIHTSGKAPAIAEEMVFFTIRTASALLQEPPHGGQIAIDLTNQMYDLERGHDKVRRKTSKEYIVSLDFFVKLLQRLILI